MVTRKPRVKKAEPVEAETPAKRRVKRSEPVVKKWIFVSRAVYLNQYVVYADTLEDAQALWSDLKDNEEEGDLVMCQQLMQEEVIDVKEAH